MIRAIILSATIAALVVLWMDEPPKPVARLVPVETPYCPVDVLQAMKHPLTGKWVKVWGEMYRPCSEQDRFHHI